MLKMTLRSEKICEYARRWTRLHVDLRWVMTEDVLPGERPGREERRSRKRVARDDRAVREPVLEELDVGARLVHPELREVCLDVHVEPDKLRAQHLICVLGDVWLELCLTTSSKSVR